MAAADAARRFSANGIARKHWSTAAPIRDVFREASLRAGLPYYNPHSLRSTLAHLGEGRADLVREWRELVEIEVVELRHAASEHLLQVIRVP